MANSKFSLAVFLLNHLFQDLTVHIAIMPLISDIMYRQGGKEQQRQKRDLKVITIRTRFYRKPRESGHSQRLMRTGKHSEVHFTVCFRESGKT